MSTQDQTFPQARSRTFGVEFELMIAYLWDYEADPHQHVASELPPILRIPEEDTETLPLLRCSTRQRVYKHVYETLKRYNIPVEGEREREHKGWVVKQDSSISPTDTSYKWFGIEVVSPAEKASPEAFQAIGYTLDLLLSKYRIAVNSSCGFHVHVGDGLEHMPLEHLKRVVGFLFAADPIIACLHPPDRRSSQYSPSIRERSRLARGYGVEDMEREEHDERAWCLRYIGREQRHGESPITWRKQNVEEDQLAAFEETRQPGHFESFIWEGGNAKQAYTEGGETQSQRASDPNEHLNLEIQKYLASIDPVTITDSDTPYMSTRTRLNSRFAYPKFGPESHQESSPRKQLEENAANSDIGVFAGVREVFASPSSCVVFWLQDTGQRTNYSPREYSCWGIEDTESVPGTIEFREAAGTTSSQWAQIWARICVGLTDFAIHAPVEDYLAVLHNLDRAASGSPYDIVDLLDQVGLFAEAAFAERRLSEYREEWGRDLLPSK